MGLRGANDGLRCTRRRACELSKVVACRRCDPPGKGETRLSADREHFARRAQTTRLASEPPAHPPVLPCPHARQESLLTQSAPARVSLDVRSTPPLRRSLVSLPRPLSSTSRRVLRVAGLGTGEKCAIKVQESCACWPRAIALTHAAQVRLPAESAITRRRIAHLRLLGGPPPRRPAGALPSFCPSVSLSKRQP